MSSLAGKIALVAGATRGGGRGIAAELGAAGATVYVTGRTTRAQQSEYQRPEDHRGNGGAGDRARRQRIAVRVDHLVPAEVEALVARIRAAQGRLDILVNDVWAARIYSSGTRRSGSTIWRTAFTCSASPSTRISSPRITPCPC